MRTGSIMGGIVMRKVTTCAIAAVLLLSGCSNYVTPVTSSDMKLADDLKIETYRDGERYVRIMKDKFQAKVQQLENQENIWKLGILGGGVTTLVGVIDKHPHTAIAGAGIAGGSYVYGQAFGPDVLRKIYLNGDAALNCVLLTGTKLNAELTALQYYVGRVQAAKLRVEKELDSLTPMIEDNPRLSGYVKTARHRLRQVDIAVGSWNVPGGVIAKRMVVTADIIRTKVNQLVKDNEPTLSSLFAASGRASDVGIALKRMEYEPGSGKAGARPEGLDPTFIGKAEEAIANLKAEIDEANKAWAQFKESNLADLGQFDRCAVADVDGPLLVFTPSDLTLQPTGALSVVVTGGRPPYTWAPVGAATGDIEITTSSLSGTSSVLQIKSKVEKEGVYDFAFSSLHPKATPQIVKITVQAKPAN